MTKSTDDITKSPNKRPKETGTPVLVRLQPDILAPLDDWCSRQRPIPSRPEAIRLLVNRGLSFDRISEATESIVHLGGELMRGIELTAKQRGEFLDAVITLFETKDNVDDELKESLERLRHDTMGD
jgi:hypothetical protein